MRKNSSIRSSSRENASSYLNYQVKRKPKYIGIKIRQMKKLPLFTLLVLLILGSCAIENLESEGIEPDLQASAGAYDPNDVTSTILNSHSVYGAMILDQHPNISAAADVEIIWDGPWKSYPNGNVYHPFKENFAGGYCDAKGTICGIIITASTQNEIFTLEGVASVPANSPAVLIRVFNDRSDMTLIEDFEHHAGSGVHGYSVLKELW